MNWSWIWKAEEVPMTYPGGNRGFWFIEGVVFKKRRGNSWMMFALKGGQMEECWFYCQTFVPALEKLHLLFTYQPDTVNTIYEDGTPPKHPEVTLDSLGIKPYLRTLFDTKYQWTAVEFGRQREVPMTYPGGNRGFWFIAGVVF